ncbi:MAG TPA: tetratricopeptide repeat protein [Longimicrobiales bacterium]|nr:tetratricopeptide repeat protein [Longimicrobiales bacterium]
MSRSFTPRQFAYGASLVLGALLVNASGVSAQAQGRMRVLVPDFMTVTGAKSKNGEKLAEQLRKQINTMNTHAPVDTNDKPVKDGLKKYQLKADEMDCTKWVQLATLTQIAQLVLCGEIDEATGQVTSKFQPIGGGEAFEVPAFAMQTPDQGAIQVVQSFGTYIQQLRVAVNCHDYIQSQSWQQALDACTQVIELNPRSWNAHYARGEALRALDRPEEAFEAFKKVLEIDPINMDAMLSAGLLAAKLGRQDVSLEYFHQYLEFEPGNEAVRLKIASDLATAGDPAGALKLMEEWTSKPEASRLAHQYSGFFAANAAQALQQASGPAADNQDATVLYQKAIASFEKVISLAPDSVDASVLRQLMVSYRGVGNTDKAVEIGRRATTASPDDAQTWNVFAEVLKDAKLIDEAVRALDRAAQLDPSIPNLGARKAVLLFESGRLDDAVAAVKAAQAAGSIDQQIAETLAMQMAARGFALTREGKLQEALPFLRAARDIGKAPLTIAMANFFEGYNLIQQAAPVLQKPNATAAEATRVKPMFERAKVLLEGAGAYTDQASTRAQLLAQVAQFIEVADAIIKSRR